MTIILSLAAVLGFIGVVGIFDTNAYRAQYRAMQEQERRMGFIPLPDPWDCK